MLSILHSRRAGRLVIGVTALAATEEELKKLMGE
jgi:hypothetical protein